VPTDEAEASVIIGDHHYQQNMGNLFLDGGLEERGHTDPSAVADAIIDFVSVLYMLCSAVSDIKRRY
jgi:hypothetical protein